MTGTQTADGTGVDPAMGTQPVPDPSAQTDDGTGVDAGFTRAMSPVPVPSSLAAALAKLQAKLPRIEKGETAEVEMKGGGKYSYTYADLAAVSAAVLPLLGSLGLAFTCRPTRLPDPDRFVLAYSLLHESGERESGEYPLPSNVTAQALGSAITYGRRYCLCAVTGVAPADDDDDAAAVQAAQTQFRQQQPASGVPADVAAAREQVKASWSVSFGWHEADPERAVRPSSAECADYYTRWKAEQGSPDMKLWDAPAAELRRYAAYLASLPPKYAGDDPATVPAETSSEGEKPEGAEVVEGGGPKLSSKQRTTIQAALSKIYGKDRQAKLAFISQLIGRPLESSNELTVREASDVIDALNQTSPGAGEHAEASDVATGPATDQTSGTPRSGEPAPGDPTTEGEG